MGAVYAASHNRSGDKACIRIFNPILSKNRRIAKRFLQEAEKAAQLTHRNIGLVYESGALPDGTTYTVSEYIEGETLEKKLEAEGFLDPLEALRIAEQILDALKEAHEQGILHRGIRPNNIIIQASGTVKLVDFGLEKAIPTAGRVTKCLSAYTGDLSDPHYMSPEQCMGQQLNQSSDIYARLRFVRDADRQESIPEQKLDASGDVAAQSPSGAIFQSNVQLRNLRSCRTRRAQVAEETTRPALSIGSSLSRRHKRGVARQAPEVRRRRCTGSRLADLQETGAGPSTATGFDTKKGAFREAGAVKGKRK